MVRSTLATRAPPCPVKLVHASKGKRTRAEPVAALYEQGRIVHCGSFTALEEELMALGSDHLSHSPDRADALVWALTDLMLGRGKAPKLRVL
jgi:phage terminase large subunit-like protein